MTRVRTKPVNVSLDKVAPSVAFVVIGFVMIVSGASGIVPIWTPPPVIGNPTLQAVLIVLGSLLVILGPMFVWRSTISAKRRIRKSARARPDVLGGTEQLQAFPIRQKKEVEVCYPRPFRHAPHLTVRFIEGDAYYSVIEQRPDGFKLEYRTTSWGDWFQLVLAWKAEGLLLEMEDG